MHFSFLRRIPCPAGTDIARENIPGRPDRLRLSRECFLRHKVFPIINSLCRIDPQPDNCANEPFIEPKKAWKMCGLTQEDGVRCLEQCGKNSPTEPAAAGGPST